MIGRAVRQLTPRGYCADVALLSPFVFAASAPADTTPDQFTFSDQSGVALSATITSASVTPVGYDAATTISITGGTYSINGGAYTASAGTLSPGDSFTARHTSSGSYLTATNTVVTLDGTVSDTFTSITQGDPANAAYIYRPFSFNWWSK